MKRDMTRHRNLNEILELICFYAWRRGPMWKEARRLATSVLDGRKQDIFYLHVVLSLIDEWPAGPLCVGLGNWAPPLKGVTKRFTAEFWRRIGYDAHGAGNQDGSGKSTNAKFRPEPDGAALAEFRREMYSLDRQDKNMRMAHSFDSRVALGVFRFMPDGGAGSNDVCVERLHFSNRIWTATRQSEDSFLELFADYGRISEKGGRTAVVDSDGFRIFNKKYLLLTEELTRPFSEEGMKRVEKFLIKLDMLEKL